MINALASLMPGEHNWMKGAQMPGQSPMAQPEKRKGVGGGIMNALSTVFEYGAPEAFQAGRQNRMNKDISNALSQGNVQGAAQAAYGANDWQTGMELGEYGQQQEANKRKQEAQGVLQLFTSLQPGQVSQYAMEDPAGFERMTGMSSDEYMQMGQRFTQMGVTPEQFADYVVKQAQAELGITPTQKDPLVVNNRVLDPNDPSKVLGDYSDPLVVNNQIVDRNNYGVQADLRTPQAPKYATTTTDEGVFGYNTADPTDRIRMGGAPARAPLVNVNTGDVGAGDRPIVDKPPKGYQRQWDADGKTYRDIPIPGSEADISTEDSAMSAFQKLQTSGFTSDLINSEIDRAIENTNAWSAGWGNMLLRDLPQTQARALNNAVTMIQANLSFDRLQQMRDESKTGGALGGVSTVEIDLLQSTVQKLDTLTDPAELVRALETVRTQLNKIQDLRKQIYAQKYGGYVSGDGSGMITPTTGADLPPGFEVVK